jgi:predicted dehydrogenase
MTEIKTKVGVIGVGVGHLHVNGYKACAEADLVGICDVNAARLAEAGDRLGVPPERRFTSVEALLEVPGLEAVSVTLPNHLHAPITIQALQAGKHVLCEKPLARTAAEAQTMVDMARSVGKTLMVCFNYRYRADARWLKANAEGGLFGRLYFAKAGWLRSVGIPALGSWFTTKSLAGGGPLIDLGVHVLDLTLWLMGHPKPVSVSGATFAEFGPRGQKGWPGWHGAEHGGEFSVEDLAAGFVRFDNGAALTVETSWGSHTRPGRDEYFVTLYGSEAGAELDVNNYGEHDTVRLFTDRAGQAVSVAPNLRAGGGHELAVKHFVEAIRQGLEPDSPGEQGVALMRIIDGLYESARTGREVSL